MTTKLRFLLLLMITCILSTHVVVVVIVADDDSDYRLLNAAMNNRIDDLKKLLDDESNTANINVQDPSSGQTPLMAAVLRGNTEIVQLLLKHGADVMIAEKGGYTPAHGAGFQGRAEIMKILQENGVDCKSNRHADGYLPLHRACWGREQRHADTVQLLLELGVSPDVPSGNGRTCEDMTNNPATMQVVSKYKQANDANEL